jgi:hypothetical protein
MIVSRPLFAEAEPASAVATRVRTSVCPVGTLHVMHPRQFAADARQIVRKDEDRPVRRAVSQPNQGEKES